MLNGIPTIHLLAARYREGETIWKCQVMRLRLYRMSLMGLVACTNLGALCIVVSVFLLMFPDGSVHVDRATRFELAMSDLLRLAGFALTCPLGWLGQMFCRGMHSISPVVVVTVPLNAYLWGWVAERAFPRLRMRIDSHS